jgi:hypothetical protein
MLSSGPELERDPAGPAVKNAILFVRIFFALQQVPQLGKRFIRGTRLRIAARRRFTE